MQTIRLQRIGKKNQPYFRVVLIEHTRKVKGIYNEALGSYNPRSKEIKLEKDRILHWISKGVKTSPTVHNMLVTHKVIAGPKIQAWKPKKSTKDAKAAATAAANATSAEKPAENPAS